MSALQEAQAVNAQLLADLQGMGAVIDPIHMLKLRLDLLTEFVFADTDESEPADRARLHFEEMWEQGLTELLQAAKAEVTKAKLLVPGPNGDQFQNVLPFPPKDAS